MKKDTRLENVCKFLMQDDKNATYDESLRDMYAGEIAKESVIESCVSHLQNGITELEGDADQEKWVNMLNYLNGAE